MSENVYEKTRVMSDGSARGCEGVTPAHPRESPESAGEVIRKIRKILDDAFRDPRHVHNYELKLLFYGEPHVVWFPVDYPPRLDRVWRYRHLVYVSITPLGGRLKVEIMEGASPSILFFETWKEAFNYISEEVARLCNYSITRAELVYTTSDVIWPPKKV